MTPFPQYCDTAHDEPFHEYPVSHLKRHSVVLGLVLYDEVGIGNHDEPFHVCVIEETVFQTVVAGFAVQFAD
jgi:hypothetical protein